MTRFFLCLSLCLAPTLSACGGCGSSSVSPEDVADYVPEEAQGVVSINIEEMAEQFRTLTPFVAHDGRWSDMGEDVDEYLEEAYGFGITDTEQAVLWVGPDEDGAAIFLGDFDDELEGETREVDGVTLAATSFGPVFAVVDDKLIVGTEAAVLLTASVLNGDHTSLEDSDSEDSEAIRELLGDVNEGTITLAGIVGELDGFGMAMLPDINGFAVSISQEQLHLRVRLSDEDAATDTVAQLNGLISIGMRGADDQIDLLKEHGGPPEIVAAIVAMHSIQLVTEELLEIEAAGSDLEVILNMEGSSMLLPLLGVGASVAIPAFLQYQQIAEGFGDDMEGIADTYDNAFEYDTATPAWVRAEEARTNLGRIYDGARAYFDADHATRTGMILPPQFPASTGRRPASVPCGEAVEPGYDTWRDTTWEALNFSIHEPHYYSYQFEASGTGANAVFTAYAFGDLDCDGVLSTFHRQAEVQEFFDGPQVWGGLTTEVENELE